MNERDFDVPRMDEDRGNGARTAWFVKPVDKYQCKQRNINEIIKY